MSKNDVFIEICAKHPPHKPLVDMFLDEVAELRARIVELEAQNKWQPIDTAPKDRYIIGFDPAFKKPFVMIWNIHDGNFQDSPPDICEDPPTPTLWMPIPSVPAIDAARQGPAK